MLGSTRCIDARQAQRIVAGMSAFGGKAVINRRRARCPLTPERWGNRPAASGKLKVLGAALQADGETRSVVTASSIRRRSAAWIILLDWTYRSRRPASALWTTRARWCGK